MMWVRSACPGPAKPYGKGIYPIAVTKTSDLQSSPMETAQIVRDRIRAKQSYLNPEMETHCNRNYRVSLRGFFEDYCFFAGASNSFSVL
jgi:hypothetical protein